MTIEERLAALEKRVADLEGQAQGLQKIEMDANAVSDLYKYTFGSVARLQFVTRVLSIAVIILGVAIMVSVGR